MLNITKLNQTSSITFGGNSNNKDKSNNVTFSPTYENILNTQQQKKSSSNVNEDKDKYDPEFKSWAINGAVVDNKYAWSQTKDTVSMYIFIPSDTRGKDVIIELLEKSLKIKLKATKGTMTTVDKNNKNNKQGELFINGEFAYSIVEPEDMYDIEWEIIKIPGDPQNRKAISIQLKKKPLPGGFSVILWWNKCFTNESKEIDVSKIKARKNYSDTKKVWDEAHKMFLEKRMASSTV